MEISLLFIGLRQMYQVEISELNRHSKVFYYETLAYWKEIKKTILRDLVTDVGKIQVSPEELDRYHLDGTVQKFKSLLVSRAEEILFQNAADLHSSLENKIIGEFDSLYKLATTFDQMLLAAANFKSGSGKMYRKTSKRLKELLTAENAKLANSSSKYSDGGKTDITNNLTMSGRLEVALGLLSLCNELRRMEVNLEKIDGLRSFQAEMRQSVQRTLETAFEKNNEYLEELLNSHIALVYEKIIVIISKFLDQVQSEVH